MPDEKETTALESATPVAPEPSPKKERRGGFREGAGRPKGSPNMENRVRIEMRRRWLERVHGIADKIFDAHQDIALGHFQTVTLPNGQHRVYKRPPNPISLEWMMEQIWGRAPQKIELQGEIETSHIITPEAEAALGAAINYAIPTKRTAAEPVSESGEAGETADPRSSISQGADGA